MKVFCINYTTVKPEHRERHFVTHNIEIQQKCNKNYYQRLMCVCVCVCVCLFCTLDVLLVSNQVHNFFCVCGPIETAIKVTKF